VRVLLSTGLRLVSGVFSGNEFGRFFMPFPPITLASLAAVLEGHEVVLLDGLAGKTSLADLRRLLDEADVVGLTVTSSAMALNAEANLRLIRLVAPHVRVVVGGHHPTVFPHEWLERGAHAVVRSEGERALPRLLDAWAAGRTPAGIEGVSWVDDAGVVDEPDQPMLPDLDDAPVPAFHLMDFSIYGLNFLPGGGGVGAVSAARGCDGGCAYCVVPVMWRGKQRRKSISRVLHEIGIQYETGIRRFMFLEDGFGHPPAHYLALAEAIRERFTDIRFAAFMRPDDAIREPRLVPALAKAGLRAVYMGFEAPRLNALRALGKHRAAGPISPEDYPSVYKQLRRNNVFTMGFYLEPLDISMDEVRRSIEAHMSYCDFPLINEWRPIPGTALERDARASGELARSMFYHDPRIPARRGKGAETDAVLNWFRQHLMFHYPLHMLSPRRTYRRFLRGLYINLLKDLFTLDLEAYRFFLSLSFDKDRLVAPARTMDRLVARYTGDEFIGGLARKANRRGRRGRLPPWRPAGPGPARTTDA